MPQKLDLLSARNVVIAAALVGVASIVATALSTIGLEDSGGAGRDSFGTRGDGFRGFVELLTELDVRVDRSAAPPRSEAPVDRTILLAAPSWSIIEVAPAYLRNLREWVARGGRLVVAPVDPDDTEWERARAAVRSEFLAGDPNVLAPLGLGKAISLRRLPAILLPATPRPASSPKDDSNWAQNLDFLPKSVVHFWNKEPVESVSVAVQAEGSLAGLAGAVRRVAVPTIGLRVLIVGRDAKLAGRLSFKTTAGDSQILAAAVKHGRGEILVLSDPILLTNALIAAEDNSVLAVRLTAPRDRPVVFDEFYHGLGVRGNPFFLLTTPGFAGVTVALVLLVGIWAWRSAQFLGPPIAEPDPSRRDVGEYIRAMGHFFRRAPDGRRFLLRELREGVLREVCQQMNLPAETPDPAAVIAALGRRDPPRAAALRQAVADADAALAGPGDIPQSILLPTIERLSRCLSPNIISRSAAS